MWGRFPAWVPSVLTYVLVAAICYIPMLLTQPGVVSDDTKTYLYIDPGGLLRGALSMWDPGVALGTVTHQNIGYLFPMGPFYWVFSSVHVPTWVAQRLWMGSILFFAAAGVLYLCSIIKVTGIGRIVAAIAYALSPYVMQYAGRISVILLPFSGLGWMLAFMILAVRRGGWRYPALFALVVAVVSGINASSIVYVIVAPLLWLPYAVWVERSATWRQALMVLVKTGLLSIVCSLWWIAGLSVEGMYGVDILKYTESVEAASSSAAASEVIRGLGYWYFYNGDRLGLWTKSSVQYTTRVPLLAASYAVPIGAFVSAGIVRWRERAFFVALVVVGLVLSVGPHPFGSPTPLGALDKAFMSGTTAGEALRSTDRATPLVILGLAVLLGAGVSAVTRRLPRLGSIGGWLSLAVVLGAAAPLLIGETVVTQFSQPAKPPSYVSAAAHYLNSVDKGTRVYAMPGEDFAAYTYGDTIDPIWAGLLTDRPFAIHEQFIQGSMPTANLLYAADNPLQQGTMDPRSIAPIARLMGAGDVLVQYDEAYARYDPPRPSLLLKDLTPTPPGLGKPIYFGEPTRNLPSLAMYDETYFDLPPGYPLTHPLAVYPVSDPRRIERADGLDDPLVVDGDDLGIVYASDVGLLSHNPTILFSGTLDADKALSAEVLGHPAQLVVTDTNRKQAFEWNSLAENTGYTETATEKPTAFVADDPGFDLFPGTPSDAMTTSVLPGVSSVTASSYGTALTLRSEDRPANAIDGNSHTSWETEGSTTAGLLGQWWQVTARHKISADSVTLTQVLPQRNESWLTNQHITKVTLTFDGKDPVTVDLGPESQTKKGEVVEFPRRSFTTMRVRIDQTNMLKKQGPLPVGASLVGFSTIEVGNIETPQIISMPSDLLDSAGRSSLADRLTIIMTRDRVAPVPPRSDPEQTIVRQFDLPTKRSFSLVGTARLSTAVADDVIDKLVGRTDSLVVSATSSSRMPGNLAATASATLDGKSSTVWMPGEGEAADVGSYLQYKFRHPVSVDHMSLEVSSDAEHSRPTEVLVSAGGVTRTVKLPAIPVTAKAGSVTTVPISFPAVKDSTLRITFAKVALRNTLSYETSLETALPIGIAEVSIPGVPLEHLRKQIPTLCRSDLLRIDGKPVPVSISGSVSSALAGDGLSVSLCGSSSAGVHLGAGESLLQTANGDRAGFNLDQIALDSAPGGTAMKEPGHGLVSRPATSDSNDAPKVRVLSESSTSIKLRVSGASAPYVLTLGESMNKGWQATVDGGPTLGQHILIDGFSNGWLVSPGKGAVPRGKAYDVTLSFAPQKDVDLALLLSAIGILVCLLLIAGSLFRRRRRRLASAHGAVAAEAGRLPAAPELYLPAGRDRPMHRSGVIAAAVVVSGLAALLIAGLAGGVVVASAMLVALVVPRARAALPVAAALAMLAAAVEVVRHQLVNHYLPGAGWSSHFSLASSLVWVAVVLLGADAGLEAVLHRHHQVREAAAQNRDAPAAPE